jgi:hypothetical protein
VSLLDFGRPGIFSLLAVQADESIQTRAILATAPENDLWFILRDLKTRCYVFFPFRGFRFSPYLNSFSRSRFPWPDVERMEGWTCRRNTDAIGGRRVVSPGGVSLGLFVMKSGDGQTFIDPV